MGVVRPPWITVDWFVKCPYNYCDHFGDKTVLARVCRFCLEDLVRDKHPAANQLDPFEIKFLIVDIPRMVSEILINIDNLAQKIRLSLDEIKINRFEADYGKFTIYKIAIEYGDLVEEMMYLVREFSGIKNQQLIIETMDTLSHSRYYVQVKVNRALFSKNEEQKSPDDDLFDSKTSALFAYLAAIRNSQAIIQLVNESRVSSLTKKELLEFALASVRVAEIIRNQFFPLELTFEELDLEKLN